MEFRSVCRMIPTFDQLGAEPKSHITFAIDGTARCRGAKQTQLDDSGPLGEELVWTDPIMTTTRIPIQSFLPAFLITRSGTTPEGKASRYASVRRDLHVAKADRSKSKGMDKGRGRTSILPAVVAWELQSQATVTTRTSPVWPAEFRASVSCCEAACNEVIHVQARDFVSAAWFPGTTGESSEQSGPALDSRCARA